jgi:hypothetical protein
MFGKLYMYYFQRLLSNSILSDELSDSRPVQRHPWAEANYFLKNVSNTFILPGKEPKTTEYAVKNVTVQKAALSVYSSFLITIPYYNFNYLFFLWRSTLI